MMDQGWWDDLCKRIGTMTDKEFQEFVDTCETQREYFAIYGKGEDEQ